MIENTANLGSPAQPPPLNGGRGRCATAVGFELANGGSAR